MATSGGVIETRIKTQTKTTMRREGDRIIVKEVETTTTTKTGQEPEVKTVERVKEYDVHNVPEEVKAELGDLALIVPSTCPRVVKENVGNLRKPTQITDAELKKLNDDCLACHNARRTAHGVPGLKYNRDLAVYAQNWAEDLASRDKFEHRKQENFGENLYQFHSTNPKTVAQAKDACDSWYSEIRMYDFETEPKVPNPGTGHFTQMIWRDTKEVGMGRSRSKSGKQYIVANYNPPGNFLGSFKSNVPKPAM